MESPAGETPKQNIPPDTLTQRIGVLTRREVEARILAPIINALGEEFDREKVIEIVKEQVIHLARQQGADLAESLGTGSSAFMDSLAYWTRDDALHLDVLENTDSSVHFNVTRCRYAELYKSLGIPELGAVLSCNRDYALIEGFNPNATLQRTQTIMQGAPHCDFRYSFPEEKNTPQGD